MWGTAASVWTDGSRLHVTHGSASAIGTTTLSTNTTYHVWVEWTRNTGATDGTMRAYDARDGRIIWEFESAKEYQTVNGVSGRGGSINGPGPTVVGGMLFMTSGYAYLGLGQPGNVLLAFSVP